MARPGVGRLPPAPNVTLLTYVAFLVYHAETRWSVDYVYMYNNVNVNTYTCIYNIQITHPVYNTYTHLYTHIYVHIHSCRLALYFDLREFVKLTSS